MSSFPLPLRMTGFAPGRDSAKVDREVGQNSKNFAPSCNKGDLRVVFRDDYAAAKSVGPAKALAVLEGNGYRPACGPARGRCGGREKRRPAITQFQAM